MANIKITEKPGALIYEDERDLFWVYPLIWVLAWSVGCIDALPSVLAMPPGTATWLTMCIFSVWLYLIWQLIKTIAMHNRWMLDTERITVETRTLAGWKTDTKSLEGADSIGLMDRDKTLRKLIHQTDLTKTEEENTAGKESAKKPPNGKEADEEDDIPFYIVSLMRGDELYALISPALVMPEAGELYDRIKQFLEKRSFLNLAEHASVEEIISHEFEAEKRTAGRPLWERASNTFIGILASIAFGAFGIVWNITCFVMLFDAIKNNPGWPLLIMIVPMFIGYLLGIVSCAIIAGCLEMLFNALFRRKHKTPKTVGVDPPGQ